MLTTEAAAVDVPETTTTWAQLCQRALTATVAGTLWTSFFWNTPLTRLPGFRHGSQGLDWLVTTFCHPSSSSWHWAIKSYIGVGVFIAFLVALGHKPRALGFGHMARHGWRLVAVSFAVAAPFLVALGLSPGMQQYYNGILSQPHGTDYLWAAVLVIAVEHALIEGGVLALGLPGKGFSEFQAEPQRTGRLAFLGFGHPPGGKGFLSWLGVPPEVWPALLGQALVFGLVHYGKDFSEFVSAFPGGLGLGLLTYRVRSVWPSIILHVGTGATILGIAYLASH